MKKLFPQVGKIYIHTWDNECGYYKDSKNNPLVVLVLELRESKEYFGNIRGKIFSPDPDLKYNNDFQYSFSYFNKNFVEINEFLRVERLEINRKKQIGE